MREGAHHGEAIAQDETVRPIHVVLVELHGFVVLLLRVSEKMSLDILARRNSQNGFLRSSARGYAAPPDRRRRISPPVCPAHSSHGARSFKASAREFDFVVGESVPCLFKKFGD